MNGKSRKSVLITGGFGYIGSYIVSRFAEMGIWDITVLSKRKGQNLPEGCKFIQADITDSDQLSSSLRDQTFDYVIHLASANDSFVSNYANLAIEINIKGTRNLLESLKNKPPACIIYFSTFHIYGAAGGTITEKTEPVPKNDYAITHLAAEYYFNMYRQNFNMPYIIFRLSNSYGCPSAKESTKWYLLFNDLCRTVFTNGKLVLKTNGRAKRDFISQEDVFYVIERFIYDQAFYNNTYNLGAGRSYTLLELAEIIRDAYFEFSGIKVPVEINNEDKSVYPDDLHFDISLLQSKLFFQPKESFKKEAINIFKLLSAK